MKDTLAIVGSHPGTRGDFDYNRTDCDIWMFNEALHEDWALRATGIFQMHKPVIWRSKTNRNDPEHYTWLKSGDTPTIFMIDDYEDVPNCEKYPLDAIFESFPTAEKYFTSSVSYAIALAVFKGYKSIDVYGVEMETGTEYGHQRTGVAYWIGFAAGQGIKVNFYSPKFFTAPLYGYEGDTQIPASYFDERLEILDKHRTGANAMYHKVRGMIDALLEQYVITYKTDLSHLDEYTLALGQNSQNFGMLDGAYQMDAGYLRRYHTMIEETGTYLIVRQEFEGVMRAAQKEIPLAYKDVTETAGALHKSVSALPTNERKEIRERRKAAYIAALDKYSKATCDFGHINGVMQESNKILHEYDQMLMASGLDIEQAEEIVKEQSFEMAVEA